jgi:hypothetical protein
VVLQPALRVVQMAAAPAREAPSVQPQAVTAPQAACALRLPLRQRWQAHAAPPPCAPAACLCAASAAR